MKTTRWNRKQLIGRLGAVERQCAEERAFNASVDCERGYDKACMNQLEMLVRDAARILRTIDDPMAKYAAIGLETSIHNVYEARDQLIDKGKAERLAWRQLAGFRTDRKGGKS